MLRHMRKYTKVIMIVVIIFFILSGFAGYGLYSRSDSGGERDYAVARINGRKIMRSATDSAMVRIAEQMGLSEISAPDWLNLRQFALDNMAVQSELEKEIKSRKVDVAKDEIDSAYVNIMDSYQTREAFKQFLENSGLKEQAVRNDIKIQLQRDKVIKALTAEINVTEQEAKEFYEAAKTSLYKRDNGYMLNIASFRIKETAQKAQAAIDGGADWDAVLDEYKGETTMSTPRDTPREMSEQMMQGSLELLKTYPLNKVSPVIDMAENEFAIFIKRSKTAERTLPFEEVSQDVINSLRSQRSESVFADLRARAKVEILDASIFPGGEVSQDLQEGQDISQDAD